MKLASEQMKRVAVVAGINLVLVAAGWFLLVAPQRHDAQSAALELQQVQQQITQLSGLRDTRAAARSSLRSTPPTSTASRRRCRRPPMSRTSC